MSSHISLNTHLCPEILIVDFINNLISYVETVFFSFVTFILFVYRMQIKILPM